MSAHLDKNINRDEVGELFDKATDRNFKHPRGYGHSCIIYEMVVSQQAFIKYARERMDYRVTGNLRGVPRALVWVIK